MVKLYHYLIRHRTMTLYWELEAKFHASALALLVHMCYEVKHVMWTPRCHGMASPWLALWGGQKLTTPYHNKTITLPNVTKHLHRLDATGSVQFLLNIVQTDTSGSINSQEFVEKLNSYWLFRKDFHQ